MNNFNIVPFDLKTDIPEVESWKTKFKDNPNYQAIEKFILEDFTYYTIAEVIQINYEMYPIGEDERKHALAIKDPTNNELMGFIIATITDKQTEEPSMLLQYFVLSPAYQHKGYGKEILQELIDNSPKYFNVQIAEMFSRVHQENYSCMSLMLNLGATLYGTEYSNYYNAVKQIKKLEEEKE